VEGGVVESAATQVQDELLARQFDRLDNLSEDQLLTLIGSESVTLPEYSSAVVRAYAPAEVVAALEREQMLATEPIDLALRGKRTVLRILDEWGEQLRAKICALKAKGVSERELAYGIAEVLAGVLAVALLGLVPGLLAAVSLCIAKYFLEKLCENWAPVPQEAPASS
jgi:hypothetical protein